MTRTVLMEGYYGRGNFGDDVLMAVTYGVLRKAMPDATIALVIGDHQRDYASTMLPGITIQRPDRHAHYDMIVHGGGGVFFDFKTYSALYQALESLIRAVGFRTFLLLEKLSRNLSGKYRFTTDTRIGMGIGVGSFSPGSPRMLRSLPILADFKALWVRDEQSIEQLAQYHSILSTEIIHGSDLAFLTEHWMPPITKTASPRPRLGVALRDWPGMNYAAIEAILKQLSADYDLTGFIFDAANDREIARILTPYTTHVWQPEHMNIADFAAQIAAQDILLTSRAHGAICGACLGVPSVVVNIEAKMEQVHAMLPNTTALVYPRETMLWANVIKQTLVKNSETDVNRNRDASEAAFEKIKRYLA